MLRLVRPGAVGADLQLLPVSLFPGVRAGTMLHLIERAVTEETVDFIQSLVAGIELTIFIGEEAIGVLHFYTVCCGPMALLC